MSKILSLKRWAPATYRVTDDPDGPVITMELKRLRFDEANRLLVANMEAFSALTAEPVQQQADAVDRILTQAEQAEALAHQANAAKRFYAALPTDLMDTIFEHWIRNVGGLEDEDGPVTTGAGLRDFVDQKMILWLLTTLQSHASLSSMEGKGSSSPSMSDSAVTSDGTSPVPNTGSGSPN